MRFLKAIGWIAFFLGTWMFSWWLCDRLGIGHGAIVTFVWVMLILFLLGGIPMIKKWKKDSEELERQKREERSGIRRVVYRNSDNAEDGDEEEDKPYLLDGDEEEDEMFLLGGDEEENELFPEDEEETENLFLMDLDEDDDKITEDLFGSPDDDPNDVCSDDLFTEGEEEEDDDDYEALRNVLLSSTSSEAKENTNLLKED